MYNESRISPIGRALRAYHDRVTAAVARRDAYKEQRDKAEEDARTAEQKLQLYDKAQILLTQTSDYARQQIKLRVEQIVSEALNVVFGGNHRFQVRLDVRGNQPVAEYWLDDGTTVTQLTKPDYDRGGGKVDVVSLALRLAIGEMEGIEGPLLLDEIGKHVSKEYAPNVAFFLKSYSQSFGRQIVLITHNQDLAEIGEVSLEVTRNASGRSEVVAV